MDKVKKLIAAGASISSAIREALQPNSLSQFALDHGLNRPLLSNAINGNARPTDDIVAALVKTLGGTADQWRVLLWEAGRPEAAGKPGRGAKAAV